MDFLTYAPSTIVAILLAGLLVLVLVRKIGPWVEIDWHPLIRWVVGFMCVAALVWLVVRDFQPALDTNETAVPSVTTADFPLAEVSATPFEGCRSGDFIPALGGSDGPVGQVICVVPGNYVWISSDPAQVEIHGLGVNSYSIGFVFMFIGPVRFTVTDVEPVNVRLDSRTDASLLGNHDGKSLSLVYKDGLVCDYADYLNSSCPQPEN